MAPDSGPFAQLKPLARLTGLIYAPLTPLLPGPLYLPAKFRIRFLPAVPTDRVDPEHPAPWEDPALVQTIANDIRATIQDELLDMLGQRRSVWF